jgi:hypothetical protein
MTSASMGGITGDNAPNGNPIMTDNVDTSAQRYFVIVTRFHQASDLAEKKERHVEVQALCIIERNSHVLQRLHKILAKSAA